MIQEEQDLSSLKRLPLIDRDGVLQKINNAYEQAQRARKPVLLYIEGEGGVGKTAILEEAQHRLSQKPDGLVAYHIIDLYDITNQTVRGLLDHVLQALGQEENTLDFAEYRSKTKEIDERQRQGDTIAAQDEQELLQDFIEGLTTLGKRKGPIVLFLDTAEVLCLLQDEFQREIEKSLDTNNPITLVDHLKALFQKVDSPIVWLIAGRPQRFRKHLKTLLSQGNIIELKPLERQDSLKYLEAIAKRLPTPRGERLHDIIQQYPDRLYRGTRGRPILLSMIADIIAEGYFLPEKFGEEESSEQTQYELERRLLERLMELGEIGSLIRIMGMLRKGVDGQLLAKLLSITEEEAQRLLEQLGKLTIVKRRQLSHPDTGKTRTVYFLHDEIYAMFDRHSRYLPPKRERQDYLEILLKYYKERIRAMLHHLGIVQWEQSAPIAAYHPLRSRLHELRAAYLHYALWLDPHQGFAYFFRQSEDAVDARDRDLFFLLHGEILRTVEQLKTQRAWPIELQQWLPLDLALRWVGFLLLIEDNVKQAREILYEKMPEWQKQRGLSRTAGLNPWFSAHQSLYEGLLKLKGNDPQLRKEATQDWRKGLDIIKNIPAQEAYTPITQTLQAFLTSYIGYQARLQGDYYEAIEAYRSAARLFRKLRMSALTTTLSNLAYAMIMVGWFRRARQILDEAEQLAQRQGNIYQQAIILNVKAILEAQDAGLKEAQELGEEALGLLDQLSNIDTRRLRAMIYTNLARIHRYAWNQAVARGRETKRWKETLWKAHEAIEAALALFPEQPKPYVVGGWGEKGAIAREMSLVYKKWRKSLKLRNALGDKIDTFKVANQDAERYLMAAAGAIDNPGQEIPLLSSPADVLQWETKIRRRVNEDLSGDPYLPTLALTNLGWHWLYQRKGEEEGIGIAPWVEAIYKLIYTLIPEEYHLPNPSKRREHANVMLWGILGKVEMLQFHTALRKWKTLSSEERKERLQRATRHGVWSLEYDHLIGEAPYDLRRAEEGLNRRILSLEDWENNLIPLLYQYGKEAAQELKYAGFYKFQEGEKATFLQWLEERFGIIKEGEL